MMPDIEGIEICRMLREKASERYTYILLLTAKSEKVELVQGMNAGADDYIVKPFDPEELKVAWRPDGELSDYRKIYWP